MASPKPVPACLVVKKGSKTRGRTSSGRPGPLSATCSSVPSGRDGRADRQRAALGHHVQGVEHEVQHGPAEHFAIGPQGMLRRNLEFEADLLRGELRGQRGLDVGHELAEGKAGQLRIAVRGEVQQIVDHHVHGAEPGADFLQHVEAFRVAAHPAAEHAQVERDRHQVVPHFMGHVRGHLAQVGQAVLAGQLAVLDFQFGGELLDLVAQRVVRLLQPQRGRVPGRQDRLQIGAGIQARRINGNHGLAHGVFHLSLDRSIWLMPAQAGAA